MIRMRVKNFGPVGPGLAENDGWIEFKPVTVFIGNQGAGKSTLAKLFSTFCWIEKALVRGDYPKKWFERKGRFKSMFLAYHRLENYQHADKGAEPDIEYEGEAWAIRYNGNQLSISELPGQNYALPQVMYVPAERNFISYVRSPGELKLSSESLKEFLSAFEQAKQSLRKAVRLPINNSEIEYDRLNDVVNLKGPDHKLRLTDASSGFQSFVPLYLVSQHLANAVQNQSQTASMSADEIARFGQEIRTIYDNNSLTTEQKRVAVSVLSGRFNKSAFINVVEEPEQNLFPSSQWEMLKSLLAFNRQGAANQLVLTTHSPYIVSYLSLAVQGKHLQQRIAENGRETLLPRLSALIPETALLAPDDVAIYQCNDQDCSITRLASYQGIPSDKNLLNEWLRMGNTLFDQLLELEEEL
ncbi:AAA family ATPase [Erwinia sp. E602]|uniref:AAA family ATPase n=1 Tax=Erwinia sp. E602 TaxID=2675378 RepID=UPI001BA83095|nr:AAA family ATPase [Erwinia sp. E602]QUG75347.1 AAA family ATPase [Erwinia sp. E602]